ncbi:FkbM family methyltransferase [Rhodopseudomonas thermotolerans]|uniref:FkbM family methyltransferase n=2 Tax=Rhodopseudomonas TaxID=1073 RepID=A0A336JTZ2_9BRAD|nr:MULTISPECIES: FkbM family methyltransferase [Rhodopseudomonas]RED26054.1 FkbM family methyltransferase [Rhodopseudomonas pentothenatexigens]REF91015.1 FkbM family methyltransferase [Rhodopseudomonas thermotolerans]SSW92978.1 FkbM family methyltransferase [Rhodopseudomonas pentothenatexigens]
MSALLDRLRARLRRLLRAPTVPFDGFTLVGYRADVPKGMIHALLAGDYEGPERNAIKAVVRPGDRVVDIGACMGVVSLTAARVAGADNVVAFEPNPAAAAVAADNFALNRLPVRLERAAVGAQAGTATLAIGDGSWLGASIGGNYQTTVEVPVRAIAEVIAAYQPTVLVLDAEGMETDILPACPMQRLRAVVAEFHLAGVDPAVIDGLRHHLGAQGFARDTALSTSGTMVCTEVWTRIPAAAATA